jgi:hypothetical protein
LSKGEDLRTQKLHEKNHQKKLKLHTLGEFPLLEKEGVRGRLGILCFASCLITKPFIFLSLFSIDNKEVRKL